jgi:hypothetical protein
MSASTIEQSGSRSRPAAALFQLVFNAVLINHPVKVTSVNEELINCLLLGFVNNFMTSCDVIAEIEAKPLKV